jgi:hypothetical protein
MEHDSEHQRSLFAAYLSGYLVDVKGLQRRRYLKSKSKEEREARETLASLLRSPQPLDRELRLRLAGLFDPQQGELYSDREIRLVRRSQGRAPEHLANSQIAKHVWDLVKEGKSVSEGIASAVERFERDESTVMKLWVRQKPALEALWDPLREVE